MLTSKEILKNLFGVDEVEDIIKLKSEPVTRARPLTPKVKRVQMTEDECRDLCHGISLEYLEGYEGRVLEYTITDETVDRYGDVVKAIGGDFANYRKNPVVLAFHNSRALPIGQALKTWYEPTKNVVKQWVLFLDDRVDRTGMAETAWRFASSGAMKTGSIGFLPREGGVRRPDETERKKMRMPAHGVIYENWELLEFSVTPVPANPNASQKEYDEVVRRGIYTEENIAAAKSFFSAEEMDAAIALVKELTPEPPAVPPDPIKTEMVKSIVEHTLSKDVTDLLSTLATKMNLLIDKLDMMAKAVERNVETLRLVVDARGDDLPALHNDTEPDDLYSDNRLAEIIEEATSRLNKRQ